MPKFQAHFHLYAENLDRAVAFYTNHFNFELLGQIENEKSDPWATLLVGNAILWLGKKGTDSGLILFIDKDIEKFVSQLIENEVEFFVPEGLEVEPDRDQKVLTTEWGKHAWFLDSEKNRIMLFQPLEQ